MTPLQRFSVACCEPLPDAFKVLEIKDDTRWCLVQREGTTLYVGFFCTIGPIWGPDWRKNFLILWHLWRGWLCHTGFWQELNSMLPQLMDQAGAAGLEKVEVCGYSQGGTHAEGFAAVLAADTDLQVELTTFGSPRFWGWVTAWVIRFLFKRRGVIHTAYRTAGDPIPDTLPEFAGYARSHSKFELLGYWSSIPSISRHKQPAYRYELSRLKDAM